MNGKASKIPTKILLIGGSGFIGSAIQAKLRLLKVDFLNSDIQSKSTLNQFEFIDLMVTRFGHQIIYISHNPQKFVCISSKNFYVSNDNGQAKVDVMNADDLIARYYSEAKISKEFE